MVRLQAVSRCSRREGNFRADLLLPLIRRLWLASEGLGAPSAPSWEGALSSSSESGNVHYSAAQMIRAPVTVESSPCSALALESVMSVQHVGSFAQRACSCGIVSLHPQARRTGYVRQRCRPRRSIRVIAVPGTAASPWLREAGTAPDHRSAALHRRRLVWTLDRRRRREAGSRRCARRTERCRPNDHRPHAWRVRASRRARPCPCPIYHSHHATGLDDHHRPATSSGSMLMFQRGPAQLPKEGPSACESPLGRHHGECARTFPSLGGVKGRAVAAPRVNWGTGSRFHWRASPGQRTRMRPRSLIVVS